MNYGIITEIVGKPWQIEFSHFAQLRPIFNAMLNGLSIEVAPEPKENMQFAIGQTSRSNISMSGISSDSSSQDRFVHVQPIIGIMTKHDQDCGPRGMRTIGQRLLKADQMADIIGHLLVMECPGGSSLAVPELDDAIQACTKPVLILVDDVWASAAVHGGRNATEIWATRENAMIGSIGTLFSFNGRKSVSEENQSKQVEITVYADESFEKNLEVREAIDNFNFKPLKDNLLNPINQEFQDNIRAAFPNVEDKHLHGATFFAKDVIGVFLHGICSMDEAVNRVFELAEKNKPQGAPKQVHNSSKISHNMKYPNIAAALIAASIITEGKELEFEEDGRRTFTDEELQTMETSLAANNSDELQQQLTAATTTISERDTTIASLQEQVVNLKKSPGAQSKKPNQEVDIDDDDAVVSGQEEMLSQKDIELFNNVKL